MSNGPSVGWGGGGGGSSGASKALDNLASVAINTSLISDTDNTDDLGSAAKQWRVVYAVTGTFTGEVSTRAGTSAAALGLRVGPDSGFWEASDQLTFSVAGFDWFRLDRGNGVHNLRGTMFFSRAAGNVTTQTQGITDVATGVLGVVGASLTGLCGFQPAQSANGCTLQILTLSELTTIAAAAFTDTTIQIPANAQVQAVSGRVTTVIPTAATFDVGIAGATTRYATGIAVAATTTFPGTIDGIRYYASATSIRITPDVQPADNSGRVRVTITYFSTTAPTS